MDLFQELNNYKYVNNLETVEVTNYANQQEVLSKTDIYFCHGGAGSTSEALQLQVPMIMIPQNADQHQNARLVQKLGLGVWLDVTKYENDMDYLTYNVKQGLDATMREWRNYKKSSTAMSEDMKASMSYIQAADYITDLVEGGKLKPEL